MNCELSERLQKLPPYLFAEIDKAKRQAINSGKDIIDLGVGDPDLSTPDFVIEKMNKTLEDASTHKYPSGTGISDFRRSVSRWYKKRFDVDLDYNNEILPLLGSKEGIAHLPLAFINNNDLVLVPDPCYPPYIGGSTLAGGRIYKMPLLEKNNFLPDLSNIPQEIANEAKLMFINYPNNPTGAVADLSFFNKIIDFAENNNIIIVHDAAYSEISFDGYKPPSFLECKGSKNVGVEFHSLSKTFNMTGWRIGWVSGNKQIIEGLTRVKSNIDSGVFNAIQKAAIVALDDERSKKHISMMKNIYRKRQEIMVAGLKDTILDVIPTKATFYLWCRIPEGEKSTKFTKKLLGETGVVVTPGVGLGSSGEGYIRISLTANMEKLEKAVNRFKQDM